MQVVRHAAEPAAALALAPARPGSPAHLNPQQLAAVEHPAEAGALLVVAGAGSGKTATLAARTARLIEQGAAPSRLLLLTFSRRAAAEMQQRVGQALADALGLRTSHPAQTPRLPWCGTFHSVAARLLRESAPRIGLATGFTVLDRGDAEDLLGLVRERLGLAARERRFPLPATCLAIHSRAVNTARALPELLARDFPWCEPERAELERLFAAFAAAKREQHSLDYDDLLLAWWHLMREPALAAEIGARFDAVLVDEAQDINHLQAAIVHALRPTGAGLTLVGDDAQAIYGFRGAEVRHLLDFPARYTAPPARVLLLERNYRSTAPILDASNAVIALAERRFAKTLWTERAGTTHRRPALRTVADESAQAAGVADAVLAARERGVVLKRQAVLFRTAHHSMALELELARRRIPFVKYGGLRFAESAHVKDLLALLRWADNPASALAAWRVARLVPGFGPASARKVVETLAAPERFKPPAAAAAAWSELQALLKHLRSDAARWPDDLTRALAWYRPQLERLHADAALRWADLQQLAALAPSHGSRTAFVTELALDPPAASSDEARDPLLDEDYLILSTIHSAKGQEWNAVHILNVVDGCLPADMAVGQREELEEERRLLYVAMTRARDELTLWVPQRFYVTQQRAFGDRHVYALRSRFVPDELLPLFDTASPDEPAAAHDEPASTHPPAAAAAPASIDLLQRLFGSNAAAAD
ncbi:MAG: ATP-dependent helicase [Betaproteobacteria bacterium]|nr:ATP-dependent helicase [Betaproteobacteria bacterium]